ncbi:uncharacterized protein PFL1_00679 [Pseudozyma flocculosa PF-1]|uniref:Related to DNA topoisomerase II binding protein n=1 Tax=Pseudozyma flocculosa TaxID=84751 RepID=A0A5C3FDG3_9BASI|nr:uncharacterized protein PFL1_00679 [Pseudozyma flocculosa PF-1]EPQ32485.1 hypothetical protein PFL1_00679 [Pseudozyma flocculosa PF-1]SPO42310.1 related to DNA topoisomerase II binding protein [Pseudozyma flocculosa]
MNRLSRSHRSTKIPNVKLRPAAAPDTNASTSSSGPSSSKRSRAHNDARDHLEDDEHFRQLRDDGVDRGAHIDADFIGGSARPLRGAIISMTGLGEAKLTLTAYATEMGAQVEGNLTEDVTHLIAERPGSEKYRCALELGMHIVHPDWITEMREKWLDGQDVDPEDLQDAYRLRPLEGVTLAFAGCSTADRRAFKKLASALGATVSNELRFDGSITHLVSGTADPRASESIRYVVHFQQRARSGIEGTKEDAAASILVVRPEWLNDCQDADGCLDEADYSVFAPPPDSSLRKELIARAVQKIPSPFTRRTAFNTRSRSAASQQSQKRPRLALEREASGDLSTHGDDGLATGRGGHDGRERGQEEEEEEAVIRISRRANQGEGGAAGNDSFARVMSQIVPMRQPGEGEGPASGDGHLPPPKRLPTSKARGGGGLLSMSRASSFAEAQQPIKRSLSTRRRSDEAATRPAADDVDAEAKADAGDLGRSTDDAATSAKPGVFAGLTIRINMPSTSVIPVMQTTLTKAGAKVLVGDDAGSADYCVVHSSGEQPARASRGDRSPRRPAAGRGRLVTQRWVEYCLHTETLVEPEMYFAGFPAEARLPLQEAAGLRVLVLGFPEGGAEAYHARRLLEEVGCTVVERLRGSTLTHVLCATDESRNSTKATRAASVGIPLVSLDWLQAARMQGRIDPSGHPIAVPDRSVSRSHSESLSRNSLGVQGRRPPFRSTSGGGLPGAASQSLHDEASQLGGVEAPLAGCFVACARSIVTGTIAIEKRAFTLGATFQAAPDSSTTHLLHQGPERQAPDLRTLAPGAVVVHPTWLDQCYEKRARIDERLFPPSLNPHKSLATAVSAPDVEESIGKRLGSSQATLAPTSQHGAVAAAKPWHRSLSAGTSMGGDGASAAAVARGEAVTLGRTDRHDYEVASLREERGRSASPLAIEPLDTGDDEETMADVSADLGGVGEETAARGEQRRGSPLQPLQETLDKEAAADQVMALLRSRALEQSAKRRSRQPPRSRKQRRSNEADVAVAAESAGTGSTSSTSTSSWHTAVSAAERVLALQAEKEAQRAAEAAAHGISLGLDRGATAMPSSTQGVFDASLRVVYDDPAARKERQKLLDLVGREERDAAAAAAAAADGAVESETLTERDQVPRRSSSSSSSAAATKVDDDEGRGESRGFGAGVRRSPRKSESPTKRPVVRRQPLARR